VVLNDLIDIFGGDMSIPDLFRIDHKADPFGTLIEAPRLVDPDFPVKFEAVDFPF
jgi:hypothetical protein|tara:strand:+ start:125 stop:289 length:165 start_codon:yes stop_codon:yes gene_type:complete